MDTLVYAWIYRGARNLLLLAALLISPIAAAALVSSDIVGVMRTAPTAIGAMESVGDVGTALPSPTGLAVQKM